VEGIDRIERDQTWGRLKEDRAESSLYIHFVELHKCLSSQVFNVTHAHTYAHTTLSCAHISQVQAGYYVRPIMHPHVDALSQPNTHTHTHTHMQLWGFRRRMIHRLMHRRMHPGWMRERATREEGPCILALESSHPLCVYEVGTKELSDGAMCELPESVRIGVAVVVE